MRVAIVAESFSPEINGVTNSVLRVIEQLERTGHQALVIAPGCGPDRYRSTPVERVPGFALPMYRSLSIGIPTGAVLNQLEGFSPDVVHLAAPTVLGAAGMRAARLLGIPTVAVYQTDLAGFARRYNMGFSAGICWNWLAWIHRQADLTLAPSTAAAWELRANGVERVVVSARGIDPVRFHPQHRSPMLRRRLAPDGEVLVGYVGRLAREKQLHLLAGLKDLPGAKMVFVGHGPARPTLEQLLPDASFVGFLTGNAAGACGATASRRRCRPTPTSTWPPGLGLSGWATCWAITSTSAAGGRDCPAGTAR